MLVVASAVIVTALFLRLSGKGAPWLPDAGTLALLLFAVHLTRIGSAAWPPHDAVASMRRHAFAIALSAIVVLAVAVRLPGYSSDLGRVPLDIDENRLASNVKRYFATGELRHDTVEHYPGAVFWLMTGASFLNYVRGLANGDVTPAGRLPVETYAHAARLANIWAGATIVAVTALIGRQLTDWRAGVLAAFIVAIVPLSVDTTVLVRNDAGMVLASVLAVWAALRLHRAGGWMWCIASGVLAGIAAGIKYSAVFTVVPVLIAASVSGTLRARATRLAAALVAFTLAVMVSNHFVWADFPNFLRQLSDQVAITGRGHWAASDNPAAFYLSILDRFGPGLPMLALAGAFGVYALSSQRAALWIFVSFPLLYVWFMTQRPSQFPRWVFPLVPFVAVAGSCTLVTFVQLVRQGVHERTKRVRYAGWSAITVIVVLAVYQPLWAGIVSFSRRLTPPTHIRAEAWIAQNAKPGATVLVENGWLDLRSSGVETRRVSDLKGTLDGGVDALAAAGAEWIVVPEPWFGHPTLKRLGFLQRFHASQEFAGSLGYDYEVYALPRQ